MKPQALALIAGLGILASSGLAASDVEGSLQMERCAALWQISLKIDERPPYQAELCRAGVIAELRFENVAGDEQFPPLSGTQQWQSEQQLLSLSLAESEGGAVLWTGALNPASSDWQTLQSPGKTPAARVKFAPLPLPPDGMVQVLAVGAPTGEILRALLQASDLKVSTSEPLDSKITLNFRAIPASSVLGLIAYEHGLIQTWDAVGAVALRRSRDAEQALVLTEQLDAHHQADFDGDPAAKAIVERVYAQMLELVKVGDAKDVPPDLSSHLDRLAVRLQGAKDWTGLVALRRDLLALAQVYDARKDSAQVAIARAGLAYALQQAATPGDEDLELLRAAEPILLAHRQQLDSALLTEHAQALTQRNFERSALALLESAFKPCTDNDKLGWLLESEKSSWALLEHYRRAGNTAAAAKVLAQWQRCMVGQDTLTLAVRMGASDDRVRAGELIEAAADYDLIFLRLPPLATMDSSELYWLIQNALLSHLAAGHYARAAEILNLVTRLQDAHSELDPQQLGQQSSPQDLLIALAAAEPQAADLWSQRYRTDEALVANPAAAGSESASGWPSFDLVVSLLIVLAERPDYAQAANRVALLECAAVLGSAAYPVAMAKIDVQKHIAQALELRGEAGASPAQLQARRVELEKLVAMTEQWATGR